MYRPQLLLLFILSVQLHQCSLSHTYFAQLIFFLTIQFKQHISLYNSLVVCSSLLGFCSSSLPNLIGDSFWFLFTKLEYSLTRSLAYACVIGGRKTSLLSMSLPSEINTFNAEVTISMGAMNRFQSPRYDRKQALTPNRALQTDVLSPNHLSPKWFYQFWIRCVSYHSFVWMEH